jgi:hypothetical protein
MIRAPRLLAVLAALLLSGSALADEPLASDSRSGWLPGTLGDVQEAIAKGSGVLFVAVQRAVDTAAFVSYPVIDLGEDASGVRAFRLSTGDRGALRPMALSTLRAETDPYLGIALFAGREQYTSSGGASVYGFEGGAALQLLEKLDLTARYRMLGYDDRNPLAEIDSEISAPLFGFKVKF